METRKLQEIVVVEGIHDKQAVLSAVTADVWVIGGNRIARRFLEELRRASLHRGIIVLTDPDGPGEEIRRRIEQAVPNCRHASLSRADAKGKQGIGVEHARPDAIRSALFAARGPAPAGTAAVAPTFCMQDLIDAGFAHGAGAAERRAAAGDLLHIGFGNAKAFLRKLNALGVTRAEWAETLQRLAEKGDGGE